MAKYVFPAVFEHEDEGYSVYFPDVEGCYTCGEDLAEAMYMAEDALALMLLHLEKEKRPIPKASDLKEVQTSGDAFVSYISCDTLEYEKKYSTKAVKKTLSIPEWLNEAAMEAGVNFSQTLHDALKAQLNIA